MKLDRTVKKLIASQQRYKCANLSRPIVGLEGFACPLWDQHSPKNKTPSDVGSFDESGYKMCHIFGKSIRYEAQDGDRYIALCRSCYHAKMAYHSANRWADSKEMLEFTAEFNRAVRTCNAVELKQLMSSVFFDAEFDCTDSFNAACRADFVTVLDLLIDRVDRPVLNTALVEACKVGNTATVSRILSDKRSNPSNPPDCSNLLHIACAKGHADIVKLLLADRRVLIPLSSLVDTFRYAASNGHSDVITVLLDQSNAKRTNLSNITTGVLATHFYRSLEAALEKDRWEVIRVLMKQHESDQTKFGPSDVYSKILTKDIELLDETVFKLFLKYSTDPDIWESDRIITSVCKRVWFTGVKHMLEDRRARAEWPRIALLTACTVSGGWSGLVVRQVLQITNMDPSFRSNEAFELACSSGESNTVRALLEDPRVKKAVQIKHIRSACEAGNADLLEVLLGAIDRSAMTTEYISTMVELAEEKAYAKVYSVLLAYQNGG